MLKLVTLKTLKEDYPDIKLRMELPGGMDVNRQSGEQIFFAIQRFLVEEMSDFVSTPRFTGLRTCYQLWIGHWENSTRPNVQGLFYWLT